MHVTFVDSHSAYLALLHNAMLIDQTKNEYYMQPADSWIQPPTEPEYVPLDETIPPAIFVLNDDCFEKIFEKLEFQALVDASEVCRRFAQAADQFFRQKKKLSINNSSPFFPAVTLGQFRRYLKHVGHYIEELNFRWHNNDREFRIERFFQKMAQFIGPQLRKINFHDVNLSERETKKLEPILTNLVCLEIRAVNNIFDLDIDFVEVCPHLEKLKLNQNMLFSNSCREWPSLRYFSVLDNEYISTDILRVFLKLNPQLRTLKFIAIEPSERIESVINHAPNIECLTIHKEMPESELSSRDIVRFINLKHLRKLSLVHLSDQLFVNIFGCLKRIPTLRELKIHISEHVQNANLNIDEAIVEFAKAIPYLEKLKISGLNLSETTFVTMIHVITNLKVIHFHRSTIRISDMVILDVVRAVQAKSEVSKKIVKLQLFVDLILYEYLSNVKQKSISDFVIVDYRCRHNNLAM